MHLVVLGSVKARSFQCLTVIEEKTVNYLRIIQYVLEFYYQNFLNSLYRLKLNLSVRSGATRVHAARGGIKTGVTSS